MSNDPELLTLTVKVHTKDGISATIIDPDSTWEKDVPSVNWIAHEYPFRMILIFPDMTLEALEFATSHPQFKRTVEKELARAITAFIETIE